MIREHDLAVLTCDIPDEHLKAGDVGTVVHVYKGGRGYEVEFMTLDGETVAVVTVGASHVRPIGKGEITHARQLVGA